MWKTIIYSYDVIITRYQELFVDQKPIRKSSEKNDFYTLCQNIHYSEIKRHATRLRLQF